MDSEPTYPEWLLSAVVIGFFVGAIGLGISAYLTSEDSLIFSRGDAAMFGAFLGAIAGPVVGFLVWATFALVCLARRLVIRITRNEDQRRNPCVSASGS